MRLTEQEIEALRAKLPKPEELSNLDLLYPSRYLKAADLRGKDVTVTITAVELDVLQTASHDVKVKPVLTLAGTDKLFVAVKTNGRSIAALYGEDPRQWVGKRVTLYPAHNVSSPRGLTDAIRVRERVPAPARERPSRPRQREPGEEG